MRTTAILTVAALSASPAGAADTRITPTVELSYTPAAERPTGLGVAVDLRRTFDGKPWRVPLAGASARIDVFADGAVQFSVEPLVGVAIVPAVECSGSPTALDVDFRPGLAIRSRGGPGLLLGGAISGAPGSHAAIAGRIASILPFSRHPTLEPRADHGRFQDSTLSVGVGGTGSVVRCHSFGPIAGRPLRDDHTQHLLPDASDAPPLASAATWLERAREEHAAVAAFLRLAAELEAVHAPDVLIADARRAAEEEVEHARLCLQRAADLSGQTLHLDQISTRPRDLGSRPDALRTLLVESFEDGVLNEGAAAVQAFVEAHSASDPTDRVVQARIATEELGHARLAGRIVAWCQGELAA